MIPSSDGTPAAQLSAWHRWELASLDVDGGARRGSAPEADAATARAAAEAERAAAAVAAARDAGYAAGHAAGIAAAANERARLAQLVQALQACATDHEQQLCDEVLDLALVLARQMVGAALPVRRELVLPMVSAALKRLPQSTQRVEIFLDPADVELVRAHLAADEFGPRCRLTADPAIGAGGCRIETEQLELDMTAGLRWSKLLTQLGRPEDWLEPA